MGHITDRLKSYCDHESVNGLDIWQDRKNSVANEASRCGRHPWDIDGNVCASPSDIW